MSAQLNISQFLNLLPSLQKTQFKTVWVTYDEEADTLYVNFKKPSYADDSELTQDDLIIRYEADEIIGLTVLNASKRATP